MRKHPLRQFISLFFLCVFGLFNLCPMTVSALPVLTEIEERSVIPIETNNIMNWPDGPVVDAQSAILIDADSGVILYAKNIHEQLYPASTTKLLTCLIAMENCSLDEIVTFSHDAVFDTPRDSSHIAIDEGEELTMEQCLNAILIASANEVAFGVAEHISGTWQEFAVLMNERAAELGCINSNFINPNGLPDEDHYTTAYDLAAIGRAFFANEFLCKISSSPRLELTPTDKQPDHILEPSRNQLLPGRPYAYEYLVGSKTGYTPIAKNTLVSCAERDGMKLIAVVMAEESPSQFADTVALFNYGFSNFDRVNVSQTETKYNIDNSSIFYSDNDIFGSSKPILSLNTEDCIILPKTVSFDDVISTISYQTGNDGQAALITYTYMDQFIGSVSVDFARDTDNSYAFENGAMQNIPKESDVKPREPKIIFINIFKVFLGILGVAGIIILLIVVHAFFTNYQFASGDRRSRRNWLRNRRKTRSRSRADVRQSKRKRKRPNRFRDYDY